MKLTFWRKHRKYPIKRGKYGHSMRRQCFDLFDLRYRPMQIIRQGLVDVSKKTVLRYFEDWKKKKHLLSYRNLRQILRANPSFNHGTVELLASSLRMSGSEIQARLEKPWGLLSMLKADPATGEIDAIPAGEKRTEVEEKLLAAVKMVNLAQVFSNTPAKELSRILDAILNLEDNSSLIIRKEHGKLTLKQEGRKGGNPDKGNLHN